MTIVALGVATELRGKGVAANTLWPATVIESLASKNFQLGSEAMWRKANILSDAVLAIIAEDPYDKAATGRMLIDDTYLKTRGVTDFVCYRCDPSVEPPRLLAQEGGEKSAGEPDEVEKKLAGMDNFARGVVPSKDERKKIVASLEKTDEELRKRTAASKL